MHDIAMESRGWYRGILLQTEHEQKSLAENPATGAHPRVPAASLIYPVSKGPGALARRPAEGAQPPVVIGMPCSGQMINTARATTTRRIKLAGTPNLKNSPLVNCLEP